MSAGSPLPDLKLERTIHEKARLLVLASLSSSGSSELSFTELKEALGYSSGNLSIQIRNLEEAGYVSVKKDYRGKRPYTGVSMTERGEAALEEYITELELLVAALRSGKATTDSRDA